jgi:hypothetical protein
VRGIGLESIARAILPLTLFGPHDYAPIIGKLARTSLFAQAVAPSVGATLIEQLGSSSASGMVVLAAITNTVMALVLYRMISVATTVAP